MYFNAKAATPIRELQKQFLNKKNVHFVNNGHFIGIL
jgi:hypothetical protein